MRQVIVEKFGGPEVLKVVDVPTPEPGPGQVRVRLTSIGMNHAELMGRRGEYKLSTGDPPFTPGLEGGGVIDAVGAGVTDRAVGQRVVLGLDAPRPHGCAVAQPNAATGGGTYRTHYLTDASRTVPAPAAIPGELLGALWLSHLTAWGALIWQQQLRRGQYVGIPAATSSVGLAAAQVARDAGAITIGLTTSASKIAKLHALPAGIVAFDHLVVTVGPDRQPTPWHKDLRRITSGQAGASTGVRDGVDVFFDPVAAGTYLETEIRCLATHGTIWVYGMLGEPGRVDLSPLIRKRAAIRGWVNNELIEAGDDAMQQGYHYVLDRFAKGAFHQHVERVFKLDDVAAAHAFMEKGEHIGKIVLVP